MTPSSPAAVWYHVLAILVFVVSTLRAESLNDQCLDDVRSSIDLSLVDGWGFCRFSPDFIPQCITENDRYCLYTATSYNNYAGVSFVIQRDTVPAVRGFVSDPDLTRVGRKNLGDVSRASDGDSDLAYVVRDLEGKGRGVIARRPIRRGEIFIVAFPAVLIDQELERSLESDVPLRHRQRLYEMAFNQLMDKERALSLAASTGGNLYEDIMRTNGFGVTIGDRKHSAIFPETARLNHACAPNSIVRFAAKSLAMEAVAIKDVPAGEELTISYIPPELPSYMRPEMLKAIYNFNCTCSLCSASDEEKKVSDERRTRLETIRDIFRDEQKTHQEIVDVTREFLRLVQEEGLEFKLKEYYSQLMETYYRLGDINAAIVFADAGLRQAEQQVTGDDEFKDALRSNLEVLRSIKQKREEIPDPGTTDT